MCPLLGLASGRFSRPVSQFPHLVFKRCKVGSLSFPILYALSCKASCVVNFGRHGNYMGFMKEFARSKMGLASYFCSESLERGCPVKVTAPLSRVVLGGGKGEVSGQLRLTG